MSLIILGLWKFVSGIETLFIDLFKQMFFSWKYVFYDEYKFQKNLLSEVQMMRKSILIKSALSKQFK